MKFKSATLLARAEAWIASADQQNAAAHTKKVAAVEEDRAKWLAEKGPLAQAEVRYVLDCVRKGRIPSRERTRVLRDHVPYAQQNVEQTQAWPSQYPKAEALVRLLKTATDDEVTTSGLADAGIRDIAWLLK